MEKIKTAQEYAEGQDKEWISLEDFVLYSSISRRFQIFVESSHADFTGIDRDEELADLGIYGSEFDAEEFAKKFIELFCNHMSLFEVDKLTEALIKYREQQQSKFRIN